ncbi:hypothetical protein BDFB_008700, partial [Asbolus verrucosus]
LPLEKLEVLTRVQRRPEVVEEVRGLMEVAPSTSIQKLPQQIHLFYGPSHTILKKEMFPYKILLRDFVPRVNYYEWFLHNMNDDILDVTFFTDEA